MFSLFNWSLRDGNRRTFLLFFFFHLNRVDIALFIQYIAPTKSLSFKSMVSCYFMVFSSFFQLLYLNLSFSRTLNLILSLPYSVSFSFCLLLILPLSHSVFFDFVVLPCNLTFRSNFCVSFAVLLGRFEIHLIGN